MKILPRGKRFLDQKGAALLLALVVMLTLSMMGGALLTLVFTRSLGAEVEYDGLRALYLAEAAFSKALWELKRNKDFDGDGLGNIPGTEFGAGYFYAEHDSIQLTIRGVGIVNDVQRSVEIQYAGNL